MVRVPSTSANLGPGFDVFGIALDLFYDLIEVTRKGEGVSVEVEGELAGLVPNTPQKNTAGVVALHFLERFDIKEGLSIRVKKGIKPSIGLGSSGASAAGVAVALNHMYETNLSKEELVKLASLGEVASAGSPHPDNVAPAIFGGFTIAINGEHLSVISLEPPKNLSLALAIPHIPVPKGKTKKARSILPKLVPLREAVHNVANSCGIVAGFMLSDVDMIGRCMIDRLVEPHRAKMITGYEEVKRRGLQAGASGVAISGAGPTMIAVVNDEKVDAEYVAKAMAEGFESVGVDAEAYAVKPAKGAEVLTSE